jgi:thioredoxin-like negative regulator of GroEL
MIAPVIDQIASETAGRLRVGKLNVDDNPVTANRFQVRGIPCLLLLQGGRELDRIVGVQPKSEILRRANHVTWAAATETGGRRV